MSKCETEGWTAALTDADPICPAGVQVYLSKCEAQRLVRLL